MMGQFFSRRNVLAVTLGAAVALSAGVAHAQSKKVIRFSSASPPADFLSKSMQVFKDEVEKGAPGVEVQLYPGSQLFRQGTEIPAMQRGTLEMNPMTTFEVSAQIEEYGFLNRAFLFRDYDHLMKVMKGPFGEAYAKAVAAKMDLVILSPGYLGTRQVNLRTVREVKSPADLNGVKLRMPATPEWLVLGQSLGVSPVPMAMPEIYLAMQTGSIDGQENPLTIMNAAKFFEVSKQVIKTAHLVQPIFYTIAKPFFDKLTPQEQQVVRAAAVKATAFNDQLRRDDEAKVEARLKELGLRVDTIDLAPFKANADKLYATSDVTKKWNQALLKQVMDVK